MLVLGLCGGFESIDENVYDLRFDEIHDSAAVLVRDGAVVAAIEQERLNRIKHTNKAPSDAVRECLAIAGVGAAELDAVAYYATEPFSDFVLGQLHLRNLSARERLTSRTMVQRIIARATGHQLDPAKIRFVGHHWAHAVSAYQQCGYPSALVVSLDGQGEGLSGMVFSGHGAVLSPLRSLPESESLGYFYRDVIRILGYEMFDEYKVMGMAPYGDPAKYRQMFRAWYELLPDGVYRLRGNRATDLLRLMAPRRKGEPVTRAHQDIAAALQETLETIVLHMLTHFLRTTRHRYLCLAGGVAHNCSMNGRVLAAGQIDGLFVQPASHDAGCALGAALAVDYGQPSAPGGAAIEHVYWGRPLPDQTRIGSELARWADWLQVEEPPALVDTAAKLMADGKVIGWVQGRSEFGPRALGNRSILADPRPAGHKDRINAMVKKREGYRPFAPSVLEERAGEFFELPAGQKRLPYMTVVVRVRPEKRSLLGAITHVDGTARVQTVAREQNPRYYALIEAFGQLTGVPIVLNTSFNNHAEPIVDSLEDAIECFLTTGLDFLVAGDSLVSKRQVPPDACLDLAAATAPTLTLRMVPDGRGGARCEALFGYHHSRVVRISEVLCEALRRADGRRSMRELVGGDLDDQAWTALAGELWELWTVRMVRLTPRELSETDSGAD